MRSAPALIVALALAVGCSVRSDARPHSTQPGTGQIRYEGGEGLGCADAVILLGARNSLEGVLAENAWIVEHHPGYRKIGQGLVGREGRWYDEIDIRNADGVEKTICFDITSFFKED